MNHVLVVKVESDGTLKAISTRYNSRAAAMDALPEGEYFVLASFKKDGQGVSSDVHAFGYNEEDGSLVINRPAGPLPGDKPEAASNANTSAANISPDVRALLEVAEQQSKTIEALKNRLNSGQ